ncbi:hypothetical protein H8E52_11275 [bacterium]|nr:hypothetical protein [bacterium]
MGFFSKLMDLDRRWLYLLVGIAAVLPILWPLNLPVKVSPPVQVLFDRMEELQPGDIIMVSFDYGPSTGPENDPMADAVIRHALQKDAKVVALALYPIGGMNEGLEELERCVGPLDAHLPSDTLVESLHFPGKFYGEDFLYLGYKDGGLAAMRQMNENMHATFPTDYWDTPLDEYALGRAVRGYEDLEFVFSAATGIIGEWWANLVNAQFGIPVAVGCTAVSAPKYFAYYKAGQMFALLGGLKGAAEYEKLVREAYPRLDALTTAEVFYAGKGSDVQSVVYTIITLFIILGNVAFFVERAQKRN